MVFNNNKLLFVASIFVIINANRHKHGLIFERAAKDYIDPTYGDFNITISKINREDQALTIYFEFYKNIYANVYMKFQVFALFSNEYRLMPLTISQSICDFLNKEWQWIAGEVRKVSNIPKYCPVPPGLYYIKKYVIDAKEIPDLPWDNIMFYLNFTYQKNNQIHPMAGLKIFLSYDRDAMFLSKHGLE